MSLIEKLTEKSAGQKGLRTIGIDFGTTNSTVAQVVAKQDEDSQRPIVACECLSLEQPTQMGPYRGTLVPSVLANDAQGTMWIGEGAKRMRAEPAKHKLVFEKNLFFETKNDIGLKRRYHRAPEDFDHATKIAGEILKFLKAGAAKASGAPASRTVLTVPASFQVNQRSDTLKAAACADLQLSDFDLLDEPIAALTDYLFTYGSETPITEPRNIVVFDFGGGTCDVFVARLEPSDGNSPLEIKTLAVSRYHRLGGGDLDAAIVHDILVPQLIEDNQLSKHHFEWSERKKLIEPALRGCAEALKEGLCREIQQLSLHGKYETADKKGIVARQAPTKLTIKKRDFIIKDPHLTAEKWEQLLKPFLDEDLMHIREGDYTMALSAFAPITDALERAKIPKSEIDWVLLAGGSSLIPQVRWAVGKFFGASQVLNFPDATAAQAAIARGAAWHAAWMECFNEPLVRPVTSQTLALRVHGHDPIPLVKARTKIPFPPHGGFESISELSLPRNFSGLLRIEIIALPEETSLHTLSVNFDKVNAGEPLNFEFRFSSGRSFDCRVGLRKEPDTWHTVKIENPLVSVANPGAARIEIESIEDELREGELTSDKQREKLIRLAELYEKVRKLEKACEVLKAANRITHEPDPYILNRMAMLYDESGDYNRMEAHYNAAAEVSGSWAGPLFNLALHLRRHKRLDEALAKNDQALDREPASGPYHILRAEILRSLKEESNAQQCAQEGLNYFPPADQQTSWQLGWYRAALRILGRTEELKKLDETRGPKSDSDDSASPQGDLPIIN